MKHKTPNIIIGIPARNEGKTIYSTLVSILNETSYFPDSVKIKVIVVLNNCTDDTEKEVDRFCKDNYPFKRKIIFSKSFTNAGIIEAQKKVWSFKKNSEIVIFTDADILIAKKSLVNLYSQLIYSDAQTVWASIQPINRPNKFFSITRILNFRDYFPNVFFSRKYLCGRTFAIKEYPFLKKSPNYEKLLHSGVFKLLNLDKGPIVDDIYLTKSLLNQHGSSSIEKCSQAVVYYNPIANLIDFIYSQRRTVIEMKRLDLLFPELNKRTKDKKHLKKKINVSVFRELPIITKLECYMYMGLYSLVRTLAEWECEIKIFFVKKGVRIGQLSIWPSLKSTKTSFHVKEDLSRIDMHRAEALR